MVEPTDKRGLAHVLDPIVRRILPRAGHSQMRSTLPSHTRPPSWSALISAQRTRSRRPSSSAASALGCRREVDPLSGAGLEAGKTRVLGLAGGCTDSQLDTMLASQVGGVSSFTPPKRRKSVS